MNPTKIEIRDPATLRLHAKNEIIPALDGKKSPDWASFKIGLSAAGPHGIPPIIITAGGDIMDGKRRWLAAKELQWPEIACVVRPEEDAVPLIVESLLGQRNMPKGAKVYLALAMFDEFVAASNARHNRHGRDGTKTIERVLPFILLKNLSSKPDEDLAVNSVDSQKRPQNQRKADGLRALAEKFGTSQELVRQAIDLRVILDANPGMKAEVEDNILNPEKPIGIGSALAGVGFLLKQGENHRGGKSIDSKRQLTLFNNILERAVFRWEYWQKFDAGMKSDHFDSVRKIASGLKPEQLEPMADYFSKLASELRKAAKA